ncbi:MAG: PTS sugar transporter subunit IIB [Erysipelotrichaceae bacterium]|nr:PTS sugar transporter subunit IIB [Erysipelotrichaceae bacterium]
MNIVNVRIDERLIHGQVAAVWTNYLSANRIMVIDKDASENSLTKSLLKMAVPKGVSLSILSPSRAVQRLQDSEAYKGENLFIVIKGPKTIKELCDLGYKFNSVNVGNISKKNGSIQVKQSVSLTEEEYFVFKDLINLGINFYTQMVPSDEKEDFLPYLNKANY